MAVNSTAAGSATERAPSAVSKPGAVAVIRATPDAPAIAWNSTSRMPAGIVTDAGTEATPAAELARVKVRNSSAGLPVLRLRVACAPGATAAGSPPKESARTRRVLACDRPPVASAQNCSHCCRRVSSLAICSEVAVLPRALIRMKAKLKSF